MTGPALTLSDRILAHLRANPIADDAKDVPRSVTQEGIADALGVRVAHVSRALKNLIQEESVTARLAHPQGGVRRARAHALTQKGAAHAQTIPLGEPVSRATKTHHAEPTRAPAGRERELAAMLASIGEAKTRGPRFVLVEGDAGSGKTRLLEAFAKESERVGARVLLGQSAPTGAEQLIGPIGPALAPLGFDRRFRARNAGSPRERAMAAATESLQQASRAEPVVLVLDDLHYAGATVADFLRGLLLALQGTRVVIVAAVRREEAWELPNGPLYTALMPLRDDPTTTHVDLAPLTREGVAALFADAGVHVLGDKKLAEEVVERVWRESGGNATYALAMGQEIADGVSEDDFFPPSVRAAAKQHFATIPEDALGVLQLCAVSGAEVGYDLIQRASESDEDSLVRTLDVLLDKLLLEEVPRTGDELRLRFRHPKVREAVLADLSATRRRWLESRVALAHQA